MKKLIVVLVLSGCATTASGIQREAAARVRACQDTDVNPMAAFAGCKQEGVKYCKTHHLPSECWVDEYEMEGLDPPPTPLP